MKQGRIAGTAVVIAAVAFLSGNVTAQNANQEKAGIQEQASNVPLELKPGANMTVAIPRGVLGKEFLLSASIIPQTGAPTSTGLAGKIVRFELFHDGVDLYESTQGLVVTDELPARRLLTTFPIVEQDKERIVIDFNKGMRRVFTEIWYGGGGGFDSSSRSRTLEVPQSRVFEVKNQGDRLIIRQSLQARDRIDDANLEERYELRYFLSLYQPSDFKGKEATRSETRYVRFFEIQPQLELKTGRATSKIARFDINKPIVFYYSANTPADYVDAVREGILYWNRAFGKEAIQVNKAPEGVTAPDAQHNIVQWVPFDNAGFAYADILVDPRVGASMHGQAYITSVFAISGKSRARELLRHMRSLAEPKEKAKDKLEWSPIHGLGEAFLPASSVCSVDQQLFAQHMAAGIEGMLGDGQLDDAAVLRASQDYVCEIVAHEVGHVLGLRHNFAGSLDSNLTHKDLDEWFHRYLSNSKTNLVMDKPATSSIMDYNVFKASVYIGYQIRNSKEVLPHDKAAIQWGYFNGTEPTDKRTLFATDHETGLYGDVRTFDFGSEPVVSAYVNMAEQIKNLPGSLVETFIAAKAPRDARDRRPLQEVNLRVGAHTSAFVGEYSRMAMYFRAAVRSIKVEHAFDYVGELNHKEVVQAHWKRLNEQVEKLGGIDRVAFSYLPVDLKLDLKEEPKDIPVAEKIDSKKLSDRLAKLLESPIYTNFVGLDEKTYSFTKEEKELILNRGRKFFEEYENEIVQRISQSFERLSRDIGTETGEPIGDDDVVAKLERRIIDFAKIVIMAKNESQRRKGRVDKSLVEVVDFKYEQETRLAAARSLNDNIGSFKGWSVDAKSDLNKQLKDEVDASLNAQNFKEFQDSILSRPLREWYLNQQAILGLLPRKPGK